MDAELATAIVVGELDCATDMVSEVNDPPAPTAGPPVTSAMVDIGPRLFPRIGMPCPLVTKMALIALPTIFPLVPLTMPPAEFVSPINGYWQQRSCSRWRSRLPRHSYRVQECSLQRLCSRLSRSYLRRRCLCQYYWRPYR